MSGDAQVFVNALREGNFFQALELANFIAQKYKKIKNYIGADELVQLGAYELSLTDINERDIAAINFLYNYIQYHQVLMNGELGYTLVTFLSLMNVALSMQKDGKFQSIVNSVTLKNRGQFDHFLEKDSDFSQLVSRNSNTSEFLNDMAVPLDKGELLNRMDAMSGPVFANFQSSMKQIQQKLMAEKLSFYCPLVQGVAQAKALKETVTMLKIRLQNKLAKDSIEFTNEGIVIFDELTTRQTKMIIRYHVIYELDQKLQNRPTLEGIDKNMIDPVLEICKHYKVNWTDRDFSQKAAGFLSLGLIPLYKGFFSKEGRCNHIIAQITEDLPPRSLDK